MIIAIFGSSCTGKTTLSRALCAMVHLPLRSCGDAIRNKAEEVGVSWHELSDVDHQAVDAETLSWAIENTPCVVEGRYLDYVLAGLASATVWVELRASPDVRCGRLADRLGNRLLEVTDLEEIDAAQLKFRRRLYGGASPMGTSIVLETSTSTIDESLERLMSFLDTISPDAG